MDSSFYTVYRTARRGMGFPLFGTAHLSWLAVTLFFVLLTVFLARNHSERFCRRMQITLCALLFADEAVKHLFLLRIGEECPDYLPLHLCSIGMFFSLAYVLHPSGMTGEFLYAVSLPGGAAALLFPGWSSLPAGGFLALHSFTYHILLVMISVIPLSSGQFRPSRKRLPAVALTLFCMAVPLYFLNQKHGTNFFFLNFPGDGNPLSWLEARLGTPGYLVGLPILTALLWTVMYLPFIIRRRD